MAEATQKIEQLLAHVERIAEEHHDGHLTIVRFTTGWKVMFGTPDLTLDAGRPQVWYLPAYSTLGEGLQALLAASGDPEALDTLARGYENLGSEVKRNDQNREEL